MKKINLLICLFFVFIFCSSVFSDTIYLKNGTQFTGKTIKQDAEKVIFKIGNDTDGVEVTFFSEDVLRIDKTEVSNFISLPFGKTEQIEIPRPTFKTEPLLTEQARAQLKQQPKIKDDENIKTQLGDLPKVTDRGLLSEEDLTLFDELLNKEEQDYFLFIIPKIKDLADKMTQLAQILINPETLTPDNSELTELTKKISSDIEGILEQLSSSQPPDTFVNFHKIFLNNLTLMREVCIDMSKGDISQSKWEKLQNLNIELQEELSKILAEKKSKSP